MKLKSPLRFLAATFLVFSIVLGLTSSTSAQQGIGFIERFALAEDRESALKELIPGTEDYYYFHALHFQNERDLAGLTRIMKEWEGRFRTSGKRKMIENREALIRYADDPEGTLAYLRRELGLNLNHQQEGKQREAQYPSKLDPELVSWERFLADALGRPGSVEHLDPTALFRFLEKKPGLKTVERRKILAALASPDVPGLVDLILADLKTKESQGYGEFPIHRVLTRKQLEQLREARPEVLNDPEFVSDYMIRLLPGPDENMESSAEVREGYLDRAEAFVAGLGHPFHSLTAHVRYQRLVHDRALGRESEKRFLSYLSVPRNVSYGNPEWRDKEPDLWRHPADLGKDYREVTGFPPANQGEEALVRSYLLKFLAADPDPSRYARFFRESWLREVFAEAKITAGIGKPSDWAALLPPSRFQALKERVDIEFDPTSREVFDLNDEVSLSVHLKNVGKLVVKVFEINTLNYYRKLGTEISTDIDLDGLVANVSETHEFNSPPQLRTLHEFPIKTIPKRRGLWVVELIGGGKSSRAVIRKGGLEVLGKTSALGQMLTVLDEANRPLGGASIWLGGEQYECDQKGRVILPFSNQPGVRSVVVQDSKGFATLANIRQPAESYSLHAGMYLQQEALRTGGKAKLMMRPKLMLADEAISLNRIVRASLELTSINLDGISASTTLRDLQFASDREFVHEFRVPDRLISLTATLRITVKVASQGGRELELSGARTFSINEVLGSEKVADLYLSKIAGSHRVEFLGRNGEALEGRNLNVSFNHRDFKAERKVTMKTSETGVIELGALEGIESVTVSATDGISRRWTLSGDRRDHEPVVTVKEGDEMRIPFVGKLSRREIAFFSLARKGYLADEFSRLRVSNGYLAANLPAGDYQLLLKTSGKSIKVMVARGEESHGYVFNEARMLELPPRLPSHLASVATKGGSLHIMVSEGDELARVHVLGTRFVPGFDAFRSLGESQRQIPSTGRARFLPSLYISGRRLGDELRYILERRYAEKFPGNMLARPEILLNPWAVRETRSSDEVLEAGDRFRRQPVPGAPAMDAAAKLGRKGKGGGKVAGSPAYEFLANAPVMVPNLVPDKDGLITIDLAAFGDRQHIQVLLVDPDGATLRTLSLGDRKTRSRDVRLLSNALDPKRHFTEQDKVSLLKAGETLKIPDLLSAQFEVYDDLDSVYRFFRTLNDDPVVREFAFVTEWAGLSDEEKQAKYSKYACHELSFFLSRKDPAFFKQVVRPYLANKRDRTFLDDYLLGEPLEGYFQPHEYARLNVVERILLAQTDPDRQAALQMDLENRLALQVEDRDQNTLWFSTAVGGGGFGDTFAGKVVEEAAKKAEAPADKAVTRARNSVVGKPKGEAAFELAEAMDGLDREMDAKQNKALREVERKTRRMVRGAELQAAADPFAAEDFGIAPAKQLYRVLEPTREWAENHYYNLNLNKQTYDLVRENRFWLDLARHGTGSGFGSGNLGAVAGNLTGIMFALSFLDLPFEAPEHEDEIDEGTLSFKAGGRVLLFHREVRESGFAENRTPLLVSQSYFQWNDRFRIEEGQKVDKFISDEFVTGVVYGSQIVVTNPTSSIRRLEVLTQIPKGAVSVNGQKATTTRRLQLQPYSTQRLELAFYFPVAGEFPAYPAHVSTGGEVVAHADSLVFKVVDEPSKVDQGSWAWISQWGDEDSVLAFIRQGNLHAIDLSRIAWRCRESAEFFKKVLGLLDLRGIYHPVLQGYAIAHNDSVELRDLLMMEERFLDRCGLALQSELIAMEPVNRRRIEHLEYRPLVNNRAHALGGENRILNPVVRSQYLKFLDVLSQQKSLDDNDHLEVTYYLFLQDRIADALSHLNKVESERVSSQMQFDYFKAYSAFYIEDLATARTIARKYEDHPVDRWRERFAVISSQIKEAEGAVPVVVKEGDREQEQDLAGSKEASLALDIEGGRGILTARNIEEVTVNYYEMDLEFLFSTNPFVSSDTSRFEMIRPNHSESLKVVKGGKAQSFQLPGQFRSSNVIVEVLGGGEKVSSAVYANELDTGLSETMGLVTVRHGKTGRTLSKVYVKVYADTPEGPKFFKDGYTDLRGKFDYASVSNQGLGGIRRFSMLIMSEDNGATVMEARVPLR